MHRPYDQDWIVPSTRVAHEDDWAPFPIDQFRDLHAESMDRAYRAVAAADPTLARYRIHREYVSRESLISADAYHALLARREHHQFTPTNGDDTP